MPHCPICKSEVDDVIHDKELEVRGKSYRQEVCYCPSCAVKFTYFAEVVEEPVAEVAEES